MARNDHSDIPELLRLLSCSDCSYEEWVRVGMGLKNSGFPFELWDEWSATDADRYSQRECVKQWDGFTTGGGYTAATVAQVCKDHGIDVRTGIRTEQKPNRKKPAPDKKEAKPETDPELIELHSRLIKTAADALRTDERARELAADYLGANVGITVEQAVERGIGVITPQVLKGFEGERRITGNYYYGPKFGCRYWLLFPMGDGYHVDRDIDEGWRERSTDEYKDTHDGYHKATKLSGMKQPEVCNPSALEADVIVVTEGCGDALAVESCGFHATPLLTTGNRGTLDALRKAGKRVVVMTDNDKAGRDAAKRIAEDLKGTCPCVVFDWPEGAPKDAGEWNATDHDGLRAALEATHSMALDATKAEKSDGGGSRQGRKIRGPRGGLLTNVIGQEVMRDYHACKIDGAPAVWTGRRWEFGKDAIERCVLEVVPDAKAHDRNEVYSYIMLKAPRVSSDKEFDGGYYVQFANATVDAVSGKKVEPTPDMFIIGTLDVDYDGHSESNLADDFLKSVSGGDEDVMLALKEVIGACICSRLCVAQAPMLIGRAGGGKGTASNGKSTFINWVRAMLGVDNYSAIDIDTLGQRFQAAHVVGKLANLVDELPGGFIKKKELGTFKALVSGGTVYTDVKGGTGFNFRPSATYVFPMNDIPRFGDSSEGIMRRLAFIPFRRRFAPGEDGYDPDIARKLAQSDVLARGAMLGLKALPELIKRGRFNHVPDMAEELEELKRANDNVEAWLYGEGIDLIDIDKVPTANVHERFVDYCHKHDMKPCEQGDFTKQIKKSDYFEVPIGSKLISVGGRKVQGFYIKCESMAPDRRKAD